MATDNMKVTWDYYSQNMENNPNVPDQWEFQDPKMEVLYDIRLYFVAIFPYIGLIYGRYLHFRILKFPLTRPPTSNHLRIPHGSSTNKR